MAMINERERERERERVCGSSICWVRYTKKIFKFNKIENPKGKNMLYISV